MKNAGATVTIIDHGVGIPSAFLPHLYERFYQINFSETLVKRGCGLGLSIVKSIMDLHHGVITIESTEGEGTIACLFFPA